MAKNEKQKEFWYILVITNDGPVFVTGVKYSPHKYAEWNKDEKPLELGKNAAKDVALGLMLNFTQAYPICAPIELTNQPYFYDKGRLEWIWNKDDKKDETA